MFFVSYDIFSIFALSSEKPGKGRALRLFNAIGNPLESYAYFDYEADFPNLNNQFAAHN